MAGNTYKTKLTTMNDNINEGGWGGRKGRWAERRMEEQEEGQDEEWKEKKEQVTAILFVVEK